MKIIKAKDYQTMSQEAASIIKEQIFNKGDSVLGFATGTTPIGTYEQLSKWYQAGLISFAKIKTVNLDEYWGLDGSHPQSYSYFMNRNLFSKIDIKPENTFLPQGDAQDYHAECQRYEQLINDLGGIDLQLLGIGNNGHIGFNEPSNVFPRETNWVELTPSTIEANARLFAKKADVPTSAITMGIKTIMQAKKIILLANGENKAHILEQALTGPIDPQVPASILQLHPDVTVIADNKALSWYN